MFYFDTSFLMPLIQTEATSAQIQRFIVGLQAETLATSHWTRVEFSSAVGREVRMGQLDRREAEEAEVRFEALIAASFLVLLPNLADYVLAKSYIANYATGLRAPDALHLAIAANNAAVTIFTLDGGMRTGGTMLGLPTSRGIAE